MNQKSNKFFHIYFLDFVFLIANAIGFGMTLLLFSGIREQLELVDVPQPMKGVPIAFIVARLLAMAFMGFAGIV